jgi:tRNA 2-thiouridine synthesizing protein D
MDGHYRNVPCLAEYDSRALMPAHSRPVLIEINTDISWETKLYFSIKRAGQQRLQRKNAIQPPKPRPALSHPVGSGTLFGEGELDMHWVISGSFGPTDPTRAMLPFLFAASAVQAGDSVTLMLFHDAVLMAVDGVGKTLVPVGPPNRYEEIAGHAQVTLWACRPCVEARGLAAGSLDRRVKLGGMNDFHTAASGTGAKVVSF